MRKIIFPLLLTVIFFVGCRNAAVINECTGDSCDKDETSLDEIIQNFAGQPEVLDILKGKQFIALRAGTLENDYFDLVTPNLQIHSPDKLLAPIDAADVKLANTYGYKYVIPKSKYSFLKGKIPSYVIINRGLDETDLASKGYYEVLIDSGNPNCLVAGDYFTAGKAEDYRNNGNVIRKLGDNTEVKPFCGLTAPAYIFCDNVQQASHSFDKILFRISGGVYYSPNALLVCRNSIWTNANNETVEITHSRKILPERFSQLDASKNLWWIDFSAPTIGHYAPIQRLWVDGNLVTRALDLTSDEISLRFVKNIKGNFSEGATVQFTQDAVGNVKDSMQYCTAIKNLKQLSICPDRFLIMKLPQGKRPSDYSSIEAPIAVGEGSMNYLTYNNSSAQNGKLVGLKFRRFAPDASYAIYIDAHGNSIFDTPAFDVSKDKMFTIDGIEMNETAIISLQDQLTSKSMNNLTLENSFFNGNGYAFWVMTPHSNVLVQNNYIWSSVQGKSINMVGGYPEYTGGDKVGGAIIAKDPCAKNNFFKLNVLHNTGGIQFDSIDSWCFQNNVIYGSAGQETIETLGSNLSNIKLSNNWFIHDHYYGLMGPTYYYGRPDNSIRTSTFKIQNYQITDNLFFETPTPECSVDAAVGGITIEVNGTASFPLGNCYGLNISNNVIAKAGYCSPSQGAMVISSACKNSQVDHNTVAVSQTDGNPGITFQLMDQMEGFAVTNNVVTQNTIKAAELQEKESGALGDLNGPQLDVLKQYMQQSKLSEYPETFWSNTKGGFGSDYDFTLGFSGVGYSPSETNQYVVGLSCEGKIDLYKNYRKTIIANCNTAVNPALYGADTAAYERALASCQLFQQENNSYIAKLEAARANCTTSVLNSLKNFYKFVNADSSSPLVFKNNYGERCFYKPVSQIEKYPASALTVIGEKVAGATVATSTKFNFDKAVKLCSLNAGGFSAENPPKFKDLAGGDFRIINAQETSDNQSYSHAGANYVDERPVYKSSYMPEPTSFSGLGLDELRTMSGL